MSFEREAEKQVENLTKARFGTKLGEFDLFEWFGEYVGDIVNPSDAHDTDIP